MDKNTFKITDWKIINADERMRVRYGMRYLEGNRLPHFSMTCDTQSLTAWKVWKYSGGGAARDLIIEHFPELAPLVKWRLCDQDGTPMHYRANGMFWYGMAAGWAARGPYDRDPLGNFKNTIVFHPSLDLAIQNDEGEIKLSLSTRELGEFLDNRLPRLQARFKKEMEEFNVQMIDMQEETALCV